MFFIITSRLPMISSDTTNRKYFKMFIAGAVLYILLHYYLFSYSKSEYVSKFRIYIYPVILSDFLIASILLRFFSKKNNLELNRNIKNDDDHIEEGMMSDDERLNLIRSLQEHANKVKTLTQQQQQQQQQQQHQQQQQQHQQQSQQPTKQKDSIFLDRDDKKGDESDNNKEDDEESQVRKPQKQKKTKTTRKPSKKQVSDNSTKCDDDTEQVDVKRNKNRDEDNETKTDIPIYVSND